MKRLNKKQNNKAFTIIEVVLVLAVAGLIFLVVFAAVPRLQASRRDNQRKRDVEALVALAIEYEGNTGTKPTAADFNAAMIGTTSSPFYSYVQNDDFSDPSTGSYLPTNTLPTTTGYFRWYIGPFLCNATGTGWGTNTGNNGDWFLIMKLERGYYCLDNA